MRSQIYFPILRAKAGEYSALAGLSEHTKSVVCPIIDLPMAKSSQGFDQLQGTAVCLLAETWGTANPFFFDLSRYDPDDKTTQGIALVTRLFESSRQLGLKATPVVGPVLERYGANGDYFRCVATIVQRDGRGVAIRLPHDDLRHTERLDSVVNEIECLLSVQDDSCDVILDFGPLDKLPESRSKIVGLLEEMLQSAVRAFGDRRFRSTIFCASSIPRTLGKLADGKAVRIPNAEFMAWSRCVDSRFGRGVRFGDYSARYAHQTDNESKASPPARINLVTRDSHLLSVGDCSSYRDLANRIAATPEFSDQGGAWGRYAVRDAARGHGGVGNATAWVARDTHMHLETITAAVKKRLVEAGEEISMSGGNAYLYDQAELGI